MRQNTRKSDWMMLKPDCRKLVIFWTIGFLQHTCTFGVTTFTLCNLHIRAVCTYRMDMLGECVPCCHTSHSVVWECDAYERFHDLTEVTLLEHFF